MIVTCPECSARYRLADDAIPPEGRAMRCASCSHRWYQAAPDAPPPMTELPPELVREFSVEAQAAPALALEPAPVAAPEPAPAPRPVERRLTPAQLAWTPAEEEDDEPPRRRHTALKNIAAVVLGLAFTAGAAAMWVPGLDPAKLDLPQVSLPPLDLSRVPWLDNLVHPPAPPASPLGVNYTVGHQALADGRPLFVIAGSIVNPTATTQPVPAIEGHLVDAGNTITYRWRIAPPVASLAAGQRVALNSSAVGQPYGGEHVTLRLTQ